MYRAVLLALLACAHAQVSLPGTCGNGTDLQILNLTALATWQEVQRVPNQLEKGQCSTLTLAAPSNGSMLVTIREVVNRTVRLQNGTLAAYLSGRVTVNFTGIVLDLRVLKSDFRNYALLSGCRNTANNTKEVYGWKLSRNTTLSSTDVSAINAAVNGTDLQNVTWISVSHDAEACKVNAAVTSQLSILLCVLAVVVVTGK